MKLKVRPIEIQVLWISRNHGPRVLQPVQQNSFGRSILYFQDNRLNFIIGGVEAAVLWTSRVPERITQSLTARGAHIQEPPEEIHLLIGQPVHRHRPRLLSR